MTRKEQILKAAEFDPDLYSENSASWIFGAQAENTRLIPLITAMASEIERLREALESLSEPCTRQDYTSGELDRVVVSIAKQALSAPSQMDELLKEEK